MARQISAEKQQMFLNEDVRTLLPRMAVPTIVAQLITTIYNIVDTYFVSTIGTNATAAVGVNSSLERTITLVGSLIGAGACSYIARLLGSKKKTLADQVLSTSFLTGFGIGIVLMLLGQLLISPLVDLLGATAECKVYSMQYASYVLYAAPFMIGSFILNMCLRSEGSATFAMIGIGIGGILNCFLDPLFIYGLDLGVMGASIATAISKFVSFCILLWPYLRKKSSVEISLKKFLYRREDVKAVLSIGSTSFFRSAMTVVANVVLNNVAGAFSTAALAAISVANRIMEFPFAIILGFGQGYQPIVGFNWGADRMDRVRASYRFALIVTLVGSLVMSAILIPSASALVHVFNRQADPAVLSLGTLCIILQSIVLFSHGVNSTINMFFAGIGKAKQALLMSTARQGYVFIPVIIVISLLKWSEGVVWAQAIADFLCIFISVPLGLYAFRLISQREAELGAKEA